MIVDELLTNRAYGFPARGNPRRIDAAILAVVHITANLAPAADQRHYANRPDSPGPSATHYIDRDGNGVHAVDERRFASWSNGDLKAPLLRNHGVAYLADLKARGYNANEGCWLEIENVGEANNRGQITAAQIETCAVLIAERARITGLSIDENTVLPHAYINMIDRANCPALVALRPAFLARLITAAKGLLDMARAEPTDETPMQIRVAKGAKLYKADNVTLDRTLDTALDWRASPYAVGTRRAMFADIDGRRDLGLVTPSETRAIGGDTKHVVTIAVDGAEQAKLAV